MLVGRQYRVSVKRAADRRIVDSAQSCVSDASSGIRWLGHDRVTAASYPRLIRHAGTVGRQHIDSNGKGTGTTASYWRGRQAKNIGRVGSIA